MPDNSQKNKHGSGKKEILVLVVIILLIILPYILFKDLDFKSFSRMGYLGIFLINFITSATVFIPIPGAVSAFIGGGILNPWIVGSVAGIGAALGELLGYLTGFGSSSVLMKHEKNMKWVGRVKDLFKKNWFVTVMVCAAMPLPFFDIIGLIAGVMKYPAWKFLVAVTAGRVARDIIFAFSGAKILPY